MRALMGVLAAGLLAAPAADAATLQPLNACYRSVSQASRETVHVHATGFTPGAAVNVAIDGAVVQRDVPALPDGTLDGNVDAPFQRRGERAFTLTVTERDRPANTAGTTSRVAALNARLKPRRSTPSRRVRFVGRGFTDGPQIYGHYLRAGKLRKTVLLGTPQGPCGRLEARHRQIPIRHPKVGRWRLQIDNQPTWSETPPGVFVRLRITVRRVFR